MSQYDQRYPSHAYGPTTTMTGNGGVGAADSGLNHADYGQFERTPRNMDFSSLKADFDARRRAMQARMEDQMNLWESERQPRSNSGRFERRASPMFDEDINQRQRSGSDRFDRDWQEMNNNMASGQRPQAREIPIKVQVLNSDGSARRRNASQEEKIPTGIEERGPLERRPDVPIVLPMSDEQQQRVAEMERQRRDEQQRLADLDRQQRLQQQTANIAREIPIKVQIIGNEGRSPPTRKTPSKEDKSWMNNRGKGVEESVVVQVDNEREEERQAERSPEIPIMLPMSGEQLIGAERKSTFEDEKMLSELKLKDGDKVMVLGRKPEVDSDVPYQQLVEMEKKTLPLLDEQATAIATDLAGLEQGFLNPAQRTEQLKKMDARLKLWHEDCMRLLEKLDAFQLSDAKTSEAQRVTNRDKRKSIVQAVQKHLQVHDELEERRKKLGQNANAGNEQTPAAVSPASTGGGDAAKRAS